MKLLAVITSLALLAPALAQDAAPYAPRTVADRTTGEIERLDPRLDALVDPNSPIEVLAEGLDWSEGPVWLTEPGYVVFSDVPRNTVYKWTQEEGLTTWLTPSGYTGDVPRGGETGSNGLALDARGRLVLCQHGDRRVARLLTPFPSAGPVADPKFKTITNNYDGKRFNSPNDLAIHSSGAIYFTDPPYGMVGKWDDPAKEIDFQGVYRVTPDGKSNVEDQSLNAPNGVALSPDEQTLYVAQSDPKKPHVFAYDVGSDGSLSNRRVLFDALELSKTRPGMPDGLKLDTQGNLFVTGPGGVLVLTPEGDHLGTIRTGGLIANCAFGDDGRTLYMTSDDLFCRVRLKTKGSGF
ncbi:Gluconolactonase precursor [Pirellulimonas nuda]|uniref:Gluconolactonase n=1 Tax=Pirellulimonas nuda TaxID=2528009 RepID=A0A518D8A6_9BACT|nr:SMP-30/gluconolactonase/LRE family protein [Pirellulimonas nuda]QDU87716.1 Gluconolactonase precursor [Pirellulimonas nuda]